MVTKMNMTPNDTFRWYSYVTSMRMPLGLFLAEFQSLCAVKTGKVLFFVTFDPCYDNQAHILVHTDWFLFLNKTSKKNSFLVRNPNLFVSLKDIWPESLLFLPNMIILIIS